MEKALICVVLGLALIVAARMLRRAIRRADELVGMDETVDRVDGVDFVDCEGCEDLVDMRESALVVDMWMVTDGFENDVAYIEDEDKARGFRDMYFPKGRIEYVETLETLKG